jgi:hypothetical protein
MVHKSAWYISKTKAGCTCALMRDQTPTGCMTPDWRLLLTAQYFLLLILLLSLTLISLLRFHLFLDGLRSLGGWTSPSSGTHAQLLSWTQAAYGQVSAVIVPSITCLSIVCCVIVTRPQSQSHGCWGGFCGACLLTPCTPFDYFHPAVSTHCVPPHDVLQGAT